MFLLQNINASYQLGLYWSFNPTVNQMLMKRVGFVRGM